MKYTSSRLAGAFSYKSRNNVDKLKNQESVNCLYISGRSLLSTSRWPYLTPFSLSTSPLNFIGGLRLDSSAMNNDTVYDVLVFQKVSDKKKAYTQYLFESEQIKFPIFGKAMTCYFRMSSYFRYSMELILGSGIFAYGRTGGSAIGKLPDAERAAAFSHALTMWGCKNLYAAVAIDAETEDSKSLPADPNVKNFGMTVIDGDVYQRVDSRMIRQKLNGIKLDRVKGMIIIRDHAHRVVIVNIAAPNSPLSIDPTYKLSDDLFFAQVERIAGYKGTPGDAVAEKMDAVISSVEQERMQPCDSNQS